MAMVVTHNQLLDAVTRAERGIKKPRKNGVLDAVEAFAFLEAYAMANWEELSDQEKDLIKALAYLVVEPPKHSGVKLLLVRIKIAWLLLLGRVTPDDFARLHAAASSFSDTVLSLVEQSSQEYRDMVSAHIQAALEANRSELVSLEELRGQLLAD
ncbi:hypothetical protein [Oceanithermus sp.]